MENPISYKDLFDPALQGEIDGLINKVKDVEKSLTDMIASVKSQAKGLGEALSGTSSSTKGGRESTKEQSDQVQKLYQAYFSLGEAYKYVEYNLTALEKSQAKMTKAIKLGETAANEGEGSIERLKAQIELAKMAYESMDAQTRENTKDGKNLMTVIRTLSGQVKNLESATKSGATTITDLGTSFSTLSGLISKTGVNITELVTSEKQMTQASKNGAVANESLQGSYNQLYAQYNLIKIVLNAMGDEMRNDIKVGKVWEQQADEIMTQLKRFQENTGDFRLSVGNYEKALNGLNISTQQILREMPTLANSASQFFIAISNNVPIFIDNFKRAQAELGGFTKALSATISTIFSWQTLLLVVLTILPKVAKAIHDKKKAAEEEAKAQKEANKENKEAVIVLKSMEEIYTDIAKAGNEAVTELKVLDKILNDTNRSWEDRVDAGKRLKEVFDEELAGFTAEEIAMGRAASNMKNLTEFVLEQAKARSTLNQITELANKQLELQAQADLLGSWRGGSASGKTVKELYDVQQAAIQAGQSIGYMGAGVAENVQKYGGLVSQIKGLQGQIDKLTEGIKPIQLLEGDNSPEKFKEKVMELPYYYNEALDAIISGMEDGLYKQLSQLDLAFKIEREKRHEQEQEILKMQETAKGEQAKILEAELSNLRLTIAAEENNYYEARERLIREHIFAMTHIEVEEQDAEADMLKDIKDRLSAEKRYRDWMAANEYDRGAKALSSREHFAYEEVDLKDKLNADLLASEKQYWMDYLVMLKDAGLELTDEYMEVVNKLASYTPKNDGQTSTHKKRGSRKYRNLTEVAFAFNPTTGEQAGPGALNRKIKDEYLDFADAVNNALQTSIDYMEEWMDKRIEMAEIAVEQAEKEANAAKTALDYEQQARANGYANNVELARKEYEEKLALQEEAVREQKRLQKIQDSINTAQQISSLVTATANLWSAYSGIPMVGPALAIAATALMWGSFLAAKMQAAQVAGTVTHGEGMAEYLDYGGSHASGHDIDFGHTKDGRRRRVERGEVVGVIRKDKVEKYGANTILDIISALNGGTFEKKYGANGLGGEIPLYTKAFSGIGNGIEANYAMAFGGGGTDLSNIESGIRELIEQNNVRVVNTPYGRIEYRGNTKRIIKNS